MVLAGSGEYNDAISTGQRTLQLALDSGRVVPASWILNTLGWIYHDLSNIELALKYNNESLELTRAHKRARASGGVVGALANLGTDYLYKKDYENAEKYFKEVEAAYDQHQLGWFRLETRLLVDRGEIALAKGNYQQALKFAEDSLAISEKAGHKKYIAKGLKLKAETLAKEGRLDEAIELMRNALKLAQPMGNPPLLWQIHYSLGLLLEQGKSLQEAQEHYAEALNVIEMTAGKLDDESVKKTLLEAPLTKAIRDSYTKTRTTS